MFKLKRRSMAVAAMTVLFVGIMALLPDRVETREGVPPVDAPTPDLGIGASLNGARPFPANNAWNIDVSRMPVHPNSANLIANIGNAVGLHPDFGTFWQEAPIGIPYVVVAGNQQPVPVNFIWWPEKVTRVHILSRRTHPSRGAPLPMATVMSLLSIAIIGSCTKLIILFP